MDWKALGLEDYPVVIKQPMDLGTIKVTHADVVRWHLARHVLTRSFRRPQPLMTQTRLESGHYTKHQQVAEDVRLVWENCKNYNQVCP